MERTREMLRSGAWLTRERVRLVALAILAASFVGLLYLGITANGLVDRQGRPLGTDFSGFYAAGTYVLDGNPQAPFDLARQHAREQQIFGATTPLYGWFYPPFFLFIAGALALMPYGIALAVWQAVTCGLYLLAIRAILGLSLSGSQSARSESIATERRVRAPNIGLWRRWLWVAASREARHPAGYFGPNPSAASAMTADWLLLALAFPAVLVNVGHGQNGFLTAALLGAALVQLDCRPLVAGILFGLLAYKPQFGLMIPVVLAASGRFRVFAAAAVTVALIAAATTIAFGTNIWPAFLASTRVSRLIALEQGDIGWYKIQSVFAWARMWGVGIPLAYTLQGATDLAVGAALVRLWRSAAPYSLKAAALCLAAILATPFALDYDMMSLAPAIAFIAADGRARGFGPWEKTALAVLWFVPLIARPIANVTHIPFGVPAMLAMFILVLRRSTLHLDLPVASSGVFLLK